MEGYSKQLVVPARRLAIHVTILMERNFRFYFVAIEDIKVVVSVNCKKMTLEMHNRV